MPIGREKPPDLGQHRLDLVVEKMLDHLDEEDHVERPVLELIGAEGNAPEQRLRSEALTSCLGRPLRDLKSLRRDPSGEQVAEEITSTAPEVEDAFCPQAELAIRPRDDPAPEIRAEVHIAPAQSLAEEVPCIGDLLGRPEDVVPVHGGHYSGDGGPPQAAQVTAQTFLCSLVSARTGAPLRLVGDALEGDPGERYQVRNGIPRLVDGLDYADTFGPQWQRYRRVQLDSATGKSHSRDRLLKGTGWSVEELQDELVLEVGCGAGRFTEVLLGAGARVVSVDASTAVDACRETCGAHANLRLVQADLHELPFEPGSFDRVFCYGVLQHTPSPEQAFRKLVEQVRPGGLLAADVYRTREYVDRWSSKRFWRPLTTRLPPDRLRRLIEWYIPRWLPIDRRLARVPRIGRFLVAVVPCWNPDGLYELGDDEHLAWTILDTFDALATRYDWPQTIESVSAWCRRVDLVDVDVRFGGNGIEINARGPEPPTRSLRAS
jgi:SAM-dependent methyltransferase